jgi:predicted regulator of Ras-like GTPase activity (Roadblock/LC7/MglB family)
MKNGQQRSVIGWFRAALRWFREAPAPAEASGSGAPPGIGSPGAAAHRGVGGAGGAPHGMAPTAAGSAASGAVESGRLPVNSTTGSGGLQTRVQPGGERVFLSLQAVLKALPANLQARVRHPVPQDLQISLPLEPLLGQLQVGLVRISFGELRVAAPGVFSGGDDCDSTLVALPLDELLRRIGTDRLPRRAPQKILTVPEDVASPFEQGHRKENRKSSSPSTRPVSAGSVPGAAPPSRVVAAQELGRFAPPPGGDTALVGRDSSASRPSVPPSRPVVPAASSALKTGLGPTVTPLTAPAVATVAMPVNGQSVHGHAKPAGAAPVTVPPTPGAATSLPAAGGTAEPLAGTVRFALSDLVPGWPEGIKQELGKLNLQGASLVLPAAILEKGLKQGRVEFPWRLVRAWIRPAVASYSSPHDAMPLTFPLSVVVPAFLEQRKPVPQPKRCLTADESIPNLFSEKGLAPVRDSVGVASGAPGPGSRAADGPGRSVAGRPSDTNFYSAADLGEHAVAASSQGVASPASGSSTELMRRLATPQEIVRRAAALEGVEGAVIALPDGLSVASQVPPHLNSDTLAAFLPQIYTKVSQCTQELRMGALNNLSFTVGQVPWKIFRVNNIFFAAFGRAGEPLPTAALAALAAELDRKPKTT